MTYEHITVTAKNALVQAVAVALVLTLGYVLLEPTVTRALDSDTDEFTVTQTIDAEISFATTANDIDLGNLPGLTGGYATGSAQFAVRTNSTTGFFVTIDFASSSMPLNGSNGASVINPYTPAGTTSPSYTYGIGGAGTPAELAFTVDASTTYYVAERYRDTGSICNAGSATTDNEDRCWDAPTTTATQIINATSSTDYSGATSTVKFVVGIPSNPNPILPSGDYVATVTLTATTQ